jgi:hypothetical protein
MTTLFLDLDVKRDKKRPSTDVQVRKALDIAAKLKHDNPCLENAVPCISGNGAYLLARLNFQTDIQTRTLQYRQFLRNLQVQVAGDPDVDLDTKVFDLPRVMAVMGTLKIKGVADDEHPYRMAQFIGEPIPEVSEKLTEAITISTPAPSSVREGQEAPECLRPSESPQCPGLELVLTEPRQVSDCSRVLFTFLVAMKYRQWSLEDIYAQIENIATRITHKDGSPAQFTGFSASRKRSWVEHNYQIANAHSRPCKVVEEVLGELSCKKDCPFEGKSLSCGHYPISPAPDADGRRTMSLDKARVKMMEDVSARVEQLIKQRRVLVLKYPPGSGKNWLAAELLKNKKCIWLTNRKEELEKIEKDLAGGLEFRTIKSKDELCTYKVFDAYRKKGYFNRESEGCRQCPDHKSCEYKKQFDDSSTLLMPSKHLTTGVLHQKNLTPELIIVDEDCLRELVDKVEIQANDLVAFRAYLSSQQLLSGELDELIKALIDALSLKEAADDPGLIFTLGRLVEDPVTLVRTVIESIEFNKFIALAQTEYIANLPPFPAANLIIELGHEADRPGGNSRIHLQGTKIVIHKFHNLDLLWRFPVVVLDASADPLIYEKIFPYREIEYLDLPITRKARVTQITNAPMGRDRYLNNDKNFAKIMEFIRQNAKGNVGIICHKKYESKLHKTFPEAVIAHYGALRGSRAFESCDSLFLVGMYFRNREELRRQAEAIFYYEQRIDPSSHVQAKDYGMDKENKQIWGLYDYSDSRLKAVADLCQAEEMRQAAYRIRPLEHNRDIYILSNVPIPGLPPDKLIKLNLADNTYKKFYRRAKYLKKIGKLSNYKGLANDLEISEYRAKRYWNRMPESLKM